MEQCDLDTEESSVLEHKEYAENILSLIHI